MKVDLGEIEQWSKFFSKWRTGTITALIEVVRAAKEFHESASIITRRSVTGQNLKEALSKIEFEDKDET